MIQPNNGNYVFIFCNRKRDAIKVLRYDRNGFVLATKKLLDDMKFQWPRTPNEVTAARTAKDFSASTWRGSCSGTSRYYKDDSGALNLKFEGDDIKQLGINLNDLKNNKSQVIDATASIDFNNWSGWKEAVDEAEKITFTFHLEQKDNNKNYSKVLISDYLDRQGF